MVISFVIAGLGCLFAGALLFRICQHDPGGGQRLHLYLCHMGRFMAWIIGWNLVLEYLAAAVHRGGGLVGLFQRIS